MKLLKAITVFEHDTLRVGDSDRSISPETLESLRKFYGTKGVPYFSLIHNGVKFNEYVGVIQVGNQVIEVLPKADRPRSNEYRGSNEKEEDSWRKLLVSMLKTVGVFNIKAPTNSSLKLNPNSILDLYYELLLNEIDYLLHRGFIKKYKTVEGNQKCLKGRIQFGKNIQQNLVHQERFYTKYTSYNVDHVFHQVLFQAVNLVSRLNQNANLSSKISTVLINFPEVSLVKINEAIFDKLIYNRSNEHYRNAISIARLLLLNFHPDVARGNNNVLAIMFDMNSLWERFAVASLRKSFRKNSCPYLLESQCVKDFWVPINSRARTIRPDILIKFMNDDKSVDRTIILDTKWKNVEKSKDISLDILRQMYVYHEYFNADKVAIVFPGEMGAISGKYVNHEKIDLLDRKCALLPVPVGGSIEDLHSNIFNVINEWIKKP